MKKNKIWISNIACVSIIAMLIVSSCKKEEVYVKPVLPPATAFIIDFSDFEAGTVKVENSPNTALNFGFSAIQVLVWKTIISVGLAVPVASYNYALEQTPTMVQANKWLWSYSIPVNQDVYTAKLYGTVTSDSVFWEMFISKIAGLGQFADYKWYTGAMDKDVTNGYWFLNDNPTSNLPVLRIDWESDEPAQTWSIRYMNVVPAGTENGGFILHGVTANPSFDAFFTIFNKGQNQTTNIEWNKTTIAGRVKAPDFYEDENWHCWDENQQDVDCSE